MNSPLNPQMLMGQFQSFMQNPAAFMSQRMNIPQGIQNDPNAIIQYMMNNGMMSQPQYNQLYAVTKRLMASPGIAGLVGR